MVHFKSCKNPLSFYEYLESNVVIICENRLLPLFDERFKMDSQVRIELNLQDKGIMITVLLIAVGVAMAGALGFYFATITVARGGGTQIGAAGQQQLNDSTVYHLMLVEPMNTAWNATVAQPRFFVQGSHGLESSANISLPAKTLIELTIVSYDTPTPNSTAAEAKVTGTVGNSMYVINSTLASMADPTMKWGANVSSVPVDTLAQTFSIPSLGINVPVPGGDMVTTYLYFNQKGVFQWLCLTPCGFGPNGGNGAMTAPGWMQGQVTIT